MRACVVPPVNASAPRGSPSEIDQRARELVDAAQLHRRRQQRAQTRQVEVLARDDEAILGFASQVELRTPARVRDVQQAAIGERRESAAQRYSRRRFEPPRSQDLFLDVDAVRNAAPHPIGEPARRGDRRAPVGVRRVDAQRVRGGRAVDCDAHVGDANRSAGTVRAFDRQRDACSGREPELTVRVETPQRCTGERQVAQADAPARRAAVAMCRRA